LFHALIARETQTPNNLLLLLNKCLGCFRQSLEEFLIMNLHRNSKASLDFKAKTSMDLNCFPWNYFPHFFSTSMFVGVRNISSEGKRSSIQPTMVRFLWVPWSPFHCILVKKKYIYYKYKVINYLFCCWILCHFGRTTTSLG
jgi:hypothetical protein